MTLTLLNSAHLFICVLLIILVLLQQGKGADAGATFGGGGNTVFGAAGADNFLTRFTTILACFFMLSSVILGLESQSSSESSGEIFKDIKTAPASSAPAATPGNSNIVTNSPDADEIQKEISSEIEKAKAAKKSGVDVSTSTSDVATSAATSAEKKISPNIIEQKKQEAGASAKKAVTKAASDTPAK